MCSNKFHPSLLLKLDNNSSILYKFIEATVQSIQNLHLRRENFAELGWTYKLEQTLLNS